MLAPCFVLTMAAVHGAAPPDQQVWSLSALALAIMYAVLVSMVYITQLGVVIPHDMRGDGARYAAFACCGPGELMTAVDLLGYTLMSLSTLFAAPVFAGGGLKRAAQLALVANGLLAPVLLAQLAWPQLIYVGALWLLTFPLSMSLLALLFAGRD